MMGLLLLYVIAGIDMKYTSKSRFGFTFRDVAREFLEKNRVHLARMYAELVDKGKR